MIVSNLHATKKRLNFNGHEQVGCFYFVPCPGQLSTGVSFCVCGDLMGLAVFADQVNISHPQELIENFKAVYNEQINK